MPQRAGAPPISRLAAKALVVAWAKAIAGGSALGLATLGLLFVLLRYAGADAVVAFRALNDPTSFSSQLGGAVILGVLAASAYLGVAPPGRSAGYLAGFCLGYNILYGVRFGFALALLALLLGAGSGWTSTWVVIRVLRSQSPLLQNLRQQWRLLVGATIVYQLTIFLFSVVYRLYAEGHLGAFKCTTCLTDPPSRLEFLHFSLVTIATVGYGDFLPVSGAARLLSGFEVLVGVIFFAVYIGLLVARLAGPSSAK